MSFKKNKYSVLKKAISKEMADFCYAYFLNKRKVARFLFDQRYISPFTEEWGVWTDHQVPNTYSHYSDIVMETLSQKVKPTMEKHTGLKLSETYTYARIYYEGAILPLHVDRPSCEYSTTICIDSTDLWDFHIEDRDGRKNTIKLNPGDMCVYDGCNLPHWRERYEGEMQMQVFLHYVNANGPNSSYKYDKRPMMGVIPKKSEPNLLQKSEFTYK